MKAFEMKFDPREAYKNEYFYDESVQLYMYLIDNGKLNINPKYIPEYYRKFSDSIYSCGWAHIDADLCYEFAEWLGEQDI